jgi:protein SHQ1
MPSAPRFHVTQDAAFVYVHVHVPYVRVSEMEFHVDGCHFSFYCKPYLLKLQFPHEVVDDELAKAVYDPNTDNGTIVVHLPKQEPGLEFPDLDLLTKLMQPKKTPAVDLNAKR